MAQYERLREKIRQSGMTVTAVAKKSEMSRVTFYNRLAGIGEFKASEIAGLTKTLSLTREERDESFFS